MLNLPRTFKEKENFQQSYTQSPMMNFKYLVLIN